MLENSSHRRRLAAPLLATFSVLALSWGSASALDAAAPAEGAKASDSPQTDSAAGLGQITITARRRKENAQTVPIAVTVVSQQSLQDNNIQTVDDLQQLVPSMSITPTFTRDDLAVSIRGQGLNSTSGLPGVVAYLNEVPIPTDQSGGLATGPGLLFDLQNVQVLKGPQGTLFGKNSVGGALLLESARPTNDFGGKIQAGFGNYGDREVDGSINIPIVRDVLLTRLAVNGQVRDGFTRLLGEPSHPNGIDADNRDYWAARGTVTFRPNDAFQNDTVVSFSDHNSHGSPAILTNCNPTGFFPLFVPGYLAACARQQALGVRTAIPVDNSLVASGKSFSVSNISSVTLADNLTFRNLVGLTDSHEVYQLDLDATSFPLVSLPSTPSDQHVRQLSEEAQLLGTSLGGRLKWIVGAFGLYAAQPPGDGFTLQTGKLVGFPFDSLTRRRDHSKALFAQGTQDLSSILSGLKLTLGARYTWDDRFEADRGGTPGSICTAPTVNCTATSYRDESSGALTWTVGLDYQFRPETMLYLTSRRGYRAGGNNSPPLTRQFGPEFVTDVELGIKSDWSLAGVPFRTNADVYYEDYQKIQVQQIYFVNGIAQITTVNAAAARLWGAEFETYARLTQHLEVGFNFDYLNFEYTKFNAGVDPTQLLATRTSDRPPRKYGVNVRYELPLGLQVGDLSMEANWSWQDRMAFHSIDTYFGQPGSVIDAYGLLNLSAGWRDIAGKPFDVSLFASNVLNKVYSIGGSSFYYSNGFSTQKFGEPRMYGVRLLYRFGAEGDNGQ